MDQIFLIIKQTWSNLLEIDEEMALPSAFDLSWKGEDKTLEPPSQQTSTL